MKPTPLKIGVAIVAGVIAGQGMVLLTNNHIIGVITAAATAFVITRYVEFSMSNVTRIYCYKCESFNWKYDFKRKGHVCQACGFLLEDG